MDYTVIYQQMLATYGKQYWWPSNSEFETIVGAILVQNTNWSNVEKSLLNIKHKTNFEPRKMILLDSENLKEMITPSGFYNAKSMTIIATLRYFEKYNFDINQMKHQLSSEKIRTELKSVKGIGDETADDLLLYVFDEPVFIPDRYARRLISFFEGDVVANKGYLPLQKHMQHRLSGFATYDFKEFHALIDEHVRDFLIRFNNLNFERGKNVK